MEKSHIIKLKDGAVEDVKSDTRYVSGGCDTCDYGSEYINNLDIILSQFSIRVEAKGEFEYLLSISDLIKLFTQNYKEIEQKTEEEFHLWIGEKISEIANDGMGVKSLSIKTERKRGR